MLQLSDLDGPAMVVHVDGIVESANVSAEALLGTGLVGSRLHDLVDGDAERVREELVALARSTGTRPSRLVIRTPRGVQPGQVVGRRLAGARPVVLLRVRTRDQFKQVTEILDRLHAEIARRMAVEEELQRILSSTVHELSEANDRLNGFAGAAAHDLRTPLSVIVGFAELLRHPAISDTRREELAVRIANAGRACAELIETLHQQVVGDEPEQEQVDLAEEVEWVARLSAQDELRLLVDPDLPTVRAPRLLVRQVLLNLVSNAVKHRGSLRQVTVRVSASRRGEGWAVTVADNGPGIPAAERDRVMEAGVQLDPDRSGGGLGLDLCRSLVDQQGGALWLADSDLGGVAVTFTLPDSTPRLAW